MWLGLDHTVWEMYAQVGPWHRSARRAVGVAVQRVGELSEEDAHALVRDAVDRVGVRSTMRAALKQAGIDVKAIEDELQRVHAELVVRVEDENQARFTAERGSGGLFLGAIGG